MNLLLSTTEKKSASVCACTATLQNQSSSFPSKQCKTQHLRAAKHIEIISIAIITTTRKARICRRRGWQQELSPHQPQCCLLSQARRWEHPLPHIHPLAPHPSPCSMAVSSALCIGARLGNGSVSSTTGTRIPPLPVPRSTSRSVRAGEPRRCWFWPTRTGEHKHYCASLAQAS